MNSSEAEKHLIAEYKTKFGDEPDEFAIMMCKSMAPRLAAGENIQWSKKGESWRTLGIE